MRCQPKPQARLRLTACTLRATTSITVTNTDPQDASAPDGWGALMRGGNALRTLVITGGVALHAVSIYVVVTIMPIVVGEIGGMAFFAWAATLYVVGSLISASAVPLLLSRIGPRTAYRLACALFLAGSLICSLAPSMGVLLAGRLVQGFGGGMLPALGYALIRAIFAPALHARAITVVGSVWGIAALAGPAVGGVFAELGAWRAAFWVDVPIALVFALASGRVLPRHEPDANAVHRPFPGLRLILLALAALALSAGGATARAVPAALGVVAAATLIVLMLRLEGRSNPRMLPAGAFDPRVPLGAVSAAMGLLILTAAPGTFIPYILRTGHAVSPLAAGYVSALYALSWTFVSFFTGSAQQRGARLAMGAGPFVMLAGLILDAAGLSAGVLPAVIAGQLLLGTGIGLGWAHLCALLMQVAPAHDRDVAGPFISTTQTLATVFGSAIAGLVANIAGIADATTPAEIATTSAWLFGVLTIVPLAACVVTWRTLVLTRPAAI